ncbi:Aste57867_21250 [Aphanomyces stellatus]|uniref:Aste57867_21250 protein n=1 Tax=Aphanomyces stellatus TaxID=120398 RepID=A0A485LHQ5_9STRA|nr:hypothetical protein As57867_021181 [Aphanomyces stellatus]VFT97922.1 Aste57867_21250 [Aphanomyces stellatus]
MPFVAWTPPDTASLGSSTSPPTLGVNFMEASQKEICIAMHAQKGQLTMTFHQDLALGVGGVLWNCGRALIACMMRHPDLIRGHNVLELGCGTGAVGLASALLQPRSVVLTDLPMLLPLATRNTLRTRAEHAAVLASVEIAVHEYTWGTPPPRLPQTRDVVLCSDCLYDPCVFDSFRQSLLDLTHDESRVLLAYKQRMLARETEVLTSLAKHFDLRVYTTDDNDTSNFNQDNVFVFLLTRRPRVSILSA